MRPATPDRSRRRVLVAAAGTWLVAAACAVPFAGDGGPPPIDPSLYPLDDRLRINDLQAKATHNSYHVETPGTRREEYRYTHAPLDVQLESEGVRAIELDIRMRTSRDGTFDVSHTPLVDEKSTCHELVECLSVVDRWSRAHPAHHPIFVMVEVKDLDLPETANDYVAEVEKEIRSVFGAGRLVTPDDAIGDAPTLRDALRTRGWPSLRSARGKIVMFALDHPLFRPAYLRADRSLHGRAMFLDTRDPDEPFAAIMVVDDPRAPEIPALVRSGVIVRTRADAEGVEARAGDRSRLDAALASGAQLIATDYPVAKDGLPYVVEIPGGTPSRCDPRIAPPACTPTAIEDPAALAATLR